MNWKKRWKKQLNEKLPSLREDVKEERIPVTEIPKQSIVSRLKTWFLANKKHVYAGAAACLAIVVTLSVTLPIALTSGGDTSTSSTVFSLEINPSAVFVVDGDREITAVVATNSDADVILSSSERVGEIEGKSLEVGVGKYVEYAAKLGYLDYDGDAIRLTACGGDKARSNEVKSVVEEGLMQQGVRSVVVYERVGIAKFSQRTGLSLSSNIKEVASTLTKKTESYAIRVAEESQNDDWESMYWDIVTKEEVKEYLEEVVQSDFGYQMGFTYLVSLNNKIKNSKDNPLGGASYFTLKASEILWSPLATEEFLALMSEMEEAITYYTSEENQLQILESIFTGITEELEKAFVEIDEFLTFTTTEISSRLHGIVNTLKENGANIKDLYIPPKNFEEYKLKATAHAQEEYEKREREYREEYAALKSITREEYDKYLLEVVEKYGSIVAYWESLKNS